jgi:hypothetical protein
MAVNLLFPNDGTEGWDVDALFTYYLSFLYIPDITAIRLYIDGSIWTEVSGLHQVNGAYSIAPSPSLTSGTTYTWAISYYQGGWSDLSETFTVTTFIEPPVGAVSHPDPRDKSIASYKTYLLAFSAVLGATSYKVYFGTDNQI